MLPRYAESLCSGTREGIVLAVFPCENSRNNICLAAFAAENIPEKFLYSKTLKIKRNIMKKWLLKTPTSEEFIRLLMAWRVWVAGAVVGAIMAALVYFIAPPPFRAQATVL